MLTVTRTRSTRRRFDERQVSAAQGHRRRRPRSRSRTRASSTGSPPPKRAIATCSSAPPTSSSSSTSTAASTSPTGPRSTSSACDCRRAGAVCAGISFVDRRVPPQGASAAWTLGRQHRRESERAFEVEVCPAGRAARHARAARPPHQPGRRAARVPVHRPRRHRTAAPGARDRSSSFTACARPTACRPSSSPTCRTSCARR